MSRARCHPTDAELRRTFERLLASGGDDGIVSCTGLDSETWEAIQRAWDTPELDAAARQEFARQLDGSHSREAEASEAAYFANLQAGGVGGGPS